MLVKLTLHDDKTTQHIKITLILVEISLYICIYSIHNLNNNLQLFQIFKLCINSSSANCELTTVCIMYVVYLNQSHLDTLIRPRFFGISNFNFEDLGFNFGSDFQI